MISMDVCIDKGGGDYLAGFKYLKEKGWAQNGWTLRDPHSGIEITFNNIAEMDSKTGIIVKHLQSQLKREAAIGSVEPAVA